MVNAEISQLFDNHRFPRGLPAISVILYFPLGIILALLRFFIGVHTFAVACLLPKTSRIRRLVLRCMCAVLGIFVRHQEHAKRDDNVKVLISNYTTTLDHLAVDLIMPCILPCVWDLPPTLMWLLGYTDMGAKQGRDTLINNAKTYTEECEVPMLVFPEGASTNGQVGLLKFSIWPFSLDQSVQPIIIQVHRPSFVKLSSSVLGGRWWIDLFWFLFVPYTLFYLNVLPVMSEEDDEEPAEFTIRVQQAMARHLSIEATPHTSADKVEYAKRVLISQKQYTNTNNRPRTLITRSVGEYDVMVSQVKEVLPHVPEEAIRRDLELTKDVDLTISNLVEGRPDISANASGPHEGQTKPTPVVAKTAASSFAKKSQDRHLSLAERKQALLETARKRYKAKHGLS